MATGLPCPACRSWGQCEGYDWFAPGDIEGHYCRFQVIWLVEHLELLWTGRWPRKPSGYIDPDGGRTSPSAHAPFEVPAYLAAVMQTRLDRTKDDGQTLVEEITIGKLRAYSSLSSAARLACDYCCGRRTRRETYRHFKSKRTG